MPSSRAKKKSAAMAILNNASDAGTKYASHEAVNFWGPTNV